MSAPRRVSSSKKACAFKTASAREIDKQFKASIAPLTEEGALTDAMCVTYFAALASNLSRDEFIAFLRSFADDLERSSAPAHSGNPR